MASSSRVDREMEEVETHRPVPEPRPRLSRSPDMVRLLPETPREADKTADAIKSLVAAEDAGGGDALGEARGLLQTPCAQSAASALIAIGHAATNCGDEALGAVKAAERAVRDVVVLRCCAPGGVRDVAHKPRRFPSTSLFTAASSATRTESSER